MAAAKASGQALGNPRLSIREAQAAGMKSPPPDRRRPQRARHCHGAGRQMGSGDRA